MEAGMFSVRGRRALVTGGRRGIGRAVVEGLLRAGADVVSVSRGELPDDMFSLAAELGRSLYSMPADLASPSAREGLCLRASDKMGGLDILVNNAGNQNKAPVSEYSLDMFRDDYMVMVEAVYDLSRQAADIMGAGSIVNVSSVSGFQGARNIVGYSTAKHAVIGLTKCLANELAAKGVRVNCLAPGLVETDMAKDTVDDPKKRAEMLGRIPSGRFGVPGDIVGPLIFLCSDAARHVHGATIVVDGGWMGR